MLAVLETRLTTSSLPQWVSMFENHCPMLSSVGPMGRRTQTWNDMQDRGVVDTCFEDSGDGTLPRWALPCWSQRSKEWGLKEPLTISPRQNVSPWKQHQADIKTTNAAIKMRTRKGTESEGGCHQGEIRVNGHQGPGFLGIDAKASAGGFCVVRLCTFHF